jgi:hypothetical protein
MKMNIYNGIIQNNISDYKRRALELVLNHPLGKGSELYADYSKISMSLVGGDFVESLSSAPGFPLLVECVRHRGGLEPEQAATLVIEFIASCLGLSSAPAEWVALELDRESEGLGDDELYERFDAALVLVQGVLDAVIADSSDAYRSSLECHLAFQVDAGLGCYVVSPAA